MWPYSTLCPISLYFIWHSLWSRVIFFKNWWSFYWGCTWVLHRWYSCISPGQDTASFVPSNSQIHDIAHYRWCCSNSSNPSTQDPSNTESGPSTSCHSNAGTWPTLISWHSCILAWWDPENSSLVLDSCQKICPCTQADFHRSEFLVIGQWFPRLCSWRSCTSVYWWKDRCRSRLWFTAILRYPFRVLSWPFRKR